MDRPSGYTPLQAKLDEQLSRLGPGPLGLFRDAFQLFQGPLEMNSANLVASSLLRELKSSIKNVLLPRDLTPAPTQEGGDKRAIEAIADLFGLRSDQITQIWSEMNLHETAHRRSLGSPRSLDDLREKWEKFQQLLSILLDTLDGAYSVIYDRLDRILATKQPGKKTLAELGGRIPNNPHTFGYFFDRVSGRRWFEVLSKSSFFNDPPAAGYWPQAAYLHRVASEYPDEVAPILEEVVGTWNYFTYHHVLEALPSLDPISGLRILRKMSSTLLVSVEGQDAYQTIDIAKHAAVLAPADSDAALDVFEILLRLEPNDETRSGLAAIRDLTSPLDHHTYSDILEHVATLRRIAPEGTLLRLLSLLDDSLSAIYLETKPEDYSKGWMPAIEPHNQNTYHFQNLPLLFEAVRDTAEYLVESETATLKDLIAQLQKLKWRVSERLILHLLTEFAEPKDKLLRFHLLDESQFFNHDLRHEYGRLLRKGYAKLDVDQQAQILDWIKSGPRYLSADLTSDEKSYLKDSFACLRLSWIRNDLVDEDRNLLQDLEARHGSTDESHEFTGYMSGPFSGPTSPIEPDQLAEMDVDQVIKLLREWEPSGERAFGGFPPSREGLARDLGTVVKEKALDYSKGATSFIGLDATYVRSLFEGLQDAVKENLSIEWESVIHLASWAVAQNREIPGRESALKDSDDHWGYARAAIARLFRQAFHAQDAARPPRELRKPIWDALQIICEDPDPDASRDSSDERPHHTAINSTRGVALQAVMGYAQWVRGRIEPLENGHDFEDMPEVEVLLNRHLDINSEASPAVRSIFGEHLFLLHILFPRWIEEQIPSLFPAEHPDLADAVLVTYLSWGRYMSPELNALLVPSLERAIAALPDHKEVERKGHRSPAVLFGQRAAAMYIYGEIDFDEHSILAQFFAKAREDERAEVISLFPNILDRGGKVGSTGRRDRAKAFWVWYRDRGSGADLRGFGSWFMSDQFDPEWRLGLLLEVLERTDGVIDVNFLLIERLADSIEVSLEKVLRCVRMITEAESAMGIQSLAHRDHLQRILIAGLSSEDAAIRKEAEVFTNRLVAIGFPKFRELLDSNEPAVDS